MTVSIRDRITAWLRGDAGDPAEPLPPRHQRRIDARARAADSGGPAWPADERHVTDTSSAGIPDITPGTPGSDVHR